MNAPFSRSIVLEEIASAIGRESAHQLIQRLGGVRIYVPKAMTPDHELAEAIGMEAAEQLSKHFHGLQLQLPVSGSRRREVVELDKDGLTKREITKRTGFSERHVYRILKPGADANQGNLFGDDE